MERESQVMPNCLSKGISAMKPRRRILPGMILGSVVLARVALAAPAESAASSTCPVQVSVDPRVELFSLIFRLAGNPEYARCRIPLYVGGVERQFGSFRNHPVVQMAAALRRTRGVSFDAPMSLAVHLADAYTLKPKVPLSPRPAEVDGRWREKEMQEFLDKARQFVRDTKFEEFFRQHQPFYDNATSQMTALLRKELQFAWFDKFFGAKPRARYYVVLAMLNGPSNYGTRVKTDNLEELYSIVGVSDVNWLGYPKFDRGMLPTLVHEFCHSYSNPIVAKHFKELQAAGERLFPKVKDKMQRMAYASWETMMYESLVRACVIRYVAFENPKAVEGMVEEERKNGFLWMKGLVDLLGGYEANRAKYPTLDAFFPRIVEFFNGYSKANP